VIYRYKQHTIAKPCLLQHILQSIAEWSYVILHDACEIRIDAIKKSGFEYVDKRPKGGSLWIIAGKTEGKKIVDLCKKVGVEFEFTATGGRASKGQPAWYSVEKH
jgi:hypothetical protein